MDESSCLHTSVDVAVLGAGTAGLAAYRAAVAHEASAVLIEHGPYGTTCARVGCMPSKLLIAAAEAAHHARHAGPFGVHASVDVDGREVMDRVKRERDRFVGFVLDGVASIPDSAKIRGTASFADRNHIEVRDPSEPKRIVARIQAKSVVIATGSSPVVPPMFNAIADRIVINDDVFAWDTLPRAVAVFGGGVIGLELSQALHRLGVRVRVFGKSATVGPLTDERIKAAALEAFRAEFPFHPDSHVTSVRRSEGGITVTYVDESGTTVDESFDYALIAAGRRPNVQGIGLETTDLPLDSAKVPLHDRTTLQCTHSSIFIAGDASNDVPLLHEAADEGRIAGANAARYPNVEPGDRRSHLSITFTDPQIAIAGASRAALLKSSHAAEDMVVGSVDFGDQGRSRVMLQNRGRAHVYADRATGRFLGAEMVGPRAEHIAHLLAWAHQQQLTIADMLRMPFYHPVIEEGLRTALRDAASQL